MIEADLSKIYRGFVPKRPMQADTGKPYNKVT